MRDRGLYVPECGDVPAHTLRLSDRAKRVRLTITPHHGLVVVVPRTMRGFDPSAVLRERRDWIDSANARFAERRAALLASADARLPDQIEFAATGERWGVEYRTTGSRTVSARAASDLVVVQGGVDDAEACLAALRRWLQRSAVERLLPLLAKESERTGFVYRLATVRGQRSRWGGCSTSGSITLNRCLLFLPPEIARAVILHELAHLRHPNHSIAFWHLLGTVDPHAQAHRRALARAWDAVPLWAEP